MKLAREAGAYALLKQIELESEKKHPGELARRRAAGNELLNLAIAIGARMQSIQGFCPIVTFAGETSASQISCDPALDVVSEGRS